MWPDDLSLKFYGDANLYRWIVEGNPGGKITPINLLDAGEGAVVLAGQCVRIPIINRTSDSNCRSGDQPYSGPLYDYFWKTLRYMHAEMMANKEKDAGGVGWYSVGATSLFTIYYPVNGNPYATPVPQDRAPERLLYDVWSNIHYGYVGRAHRIPADQLIGGAVLFGGISDAGDDISVRLGISLWSRYGAGLTQGQLYQAVLAKVRAWRDAADGHVRAPLKPR
jgi:hypothetical protein